MGVRDNENHGNRINTSHASQGALYNIRITHMNERVSESQSVRSDSLRPYELKHSPWNSPGQNTGVGSLSLLQGLFPTQGSNPGADSLPAELPGKPKNTGVGNLSLLQQIFLTQESNWGLLHCRWILYQLSYQGSPQYLRICILRRTSPPGIMV